MKIGSHPKPPTPLGSDASVPATSPVKTRTDPCMSATATAQTALAERSWPESIPRMPSLPTLETNHLVSAPGRPFQAATTSPEPSTRTGWAPSALSAATSATSRACISGTSWGPRAARSSSTPSISCASRRLCSFVVTKTALTLPIAPKSTIDVSFVIQSAPMREVRVESLEKLEVSGGQTRLSANSGGLSIVFPREIWERILAEAPAHEGPDPTELEELDGLKRELKAHAEEHAFETVIEGVQCGSDPGLEYDLVLRPAGLYAMTTGYHFAPVVGPDLMARIGRSLGDDDLVEQAYVIGAVASLDALTVGDDNLKALSVRGRRCTSSRFEMATELWHTLHERLRWNNVETFVGEKG